MEISIGNKYRLSGNADGFLPNGGQKPFTLSRSWVFKCVGKKGGEPRKETYVVLEISGDGAPSNTTVEVFRPTFLTEFREC